MVLENGYRLNVGIVVMNENKALLLAKRNGTSGGWQFPQGGVNEGETVEVAMYRELHEELGLTADDVSIVAESSAWYRYDLPEKFIRRHQEPVCIGQKQKWFLLRLSADESAINLANPEGEYAEFVEWRWSNWEEPIALVIDFKKAVYEQMLAEFRLLLSS